MIRLAIAEEHAIVRWALCAAFAKLDDMTVVGDAGTIDDTIAMILRVKPDVLLLDMTLPRDGHHLLNQIRDLEAGPIVVMLTSHAEPTYGARAIAAGAHGIVPKTSTPDQLVDAIRLVMRGERAVPPDVEALLAVSHGHPAAELTRRELEVMEMLARGMTNREIANDLEISNKTVDTHRNHILKKLSLRNNSELTRFAVRHGYVSL